MIAIPDATLAALWAEAQAAYPEECCGFLLGTVQGELRQVTQARAIDNTSADERRRRFWIGPEAYRAAEHAADARGWALLGFYHSHPDHPARPSAYDLTHALPWHTYVILAVENGRPGAWTAWVLAADRSRFDVEATCEAGSWRSGC